jgi:hypothetical protein
MITISKKILAAIILAIILAAGGIGYLTGKTRAVARYVDEDTALREAIGEWKPQAKPKGY